MIDSSVVRSPGWWLVQLSQRLNARRFSSDWSPSVWDRKVRPPLDLLDDYLRGDPPLTHVAEGWQESMRQFLRMSRMNYALLSVQAVQHRMNPVGFRTAVDDDRDGDAVAARVFRANDLALRFSEVAEWMLGLGDGYMIVGPPPAGGEWPVITSEDPREVITAQDPRTGATIAALKLSVDEWTGGTSAYVYLPGRVFVARSKTQGSVAVSVDASGFAWDSDLGDAEGQALPSSLNNTVPVTRFCNARGVGEFEPHLDVLDRINDGIFERVTIAKLQAFRQRALIGTPDYDADGNLIDYGGAFTASPGSLWRVPEGTTIWESGSVDLGPIRMSVKDDVEGFAAVTMTPLHYITPDAAQGSAEGASVMREGHLFRVEDRMRRADSALATVMGQAFAWMGDAARSDATSIRTIWGATKRHSLAERYSAFSQAKAGGLPFASALTEVLGIAPADVPRIEAERGADILFSDLASAPAAQ